MAEVVEKISGIERRVKAMVPIASFQNEITQRLQQILKTARFKGYRPGKVPMKIVEQQHGGDVRGEIYSKAIESKFGEIVQENNLRVAGMPDIRHEPLDKVNADFEFTATFEVFPEFKLTDLKKQKITQYETAISAADVKKTIDVIAKQRAVYNKVARASKMEDKVMALMQSAIDGKVAESSGTEPLEFIMGDPSRVKGFDTALVGLKAGETKAFTVKYPKTHEPKELAGKDVEYVVTLKEVQEPTLPKIDEDFAKSLGVADGDLKKMNEEIKKSLEQESDRRTKANLKQQVFTALVEGHSFDLPKALVGGEVNRLAQSTYQNLQRQGMDPKDIKLEPSMFEENAKTACKLRIILGKIVDTHSLQANAEQIKAKVEEFSSNYDDSAQAIKWFYEDEKRLDEPKSLATEDNVVDWFVGQCKKETKKIELDLVLAGQFN
ncbi:MAG: trigger factor [Betaproteobacteria bacterium]|jgi:trigger factor|uniref:Trigger factor n=1 Tax=Methylophilales bacterium HTCC2181 TaxID=383631 RepID=A0P6S7_9PROT|nr:trigger factor [Methylophilales bacterium HTCC2181]MCH9781668.1 trigger factor [Betaproteobacteria bacterium]